MLIRPATAADDPGLVKLMEETAMPGPVRLAFGCRPSFFNALRVEGDDPLVYVSERDGAIVAAGASTSRSVYLNGAPDRARYLSALRIAEAARGSLTLARGYARFQSALRVRGSRLTFTSILASNRHAERILTSARAGLPRYTPLVDAVTYLLPGRRSRPSASVQRGAEGHEGELCRFLREEGSRRNLFPVCAPADFEGQATGTFPGLSARDFLIAREHRKIVGAMGCWDVMNRRQALVTGYEGAIRWLRPVLNVSMRLARYPALPKPGAPLRLLFGALAVVRRDESCIYSALLSAALSETARRKMDYFVVSLAETDPLQVALQGFKRREVRSRLYRVTMEGDEGGLTLDKRPVHVEAATL